MGRSSFHPCFIAKHTIQPHRELVIVNRVLIDVDERVTENNQRLIGGVCRSGSSSHQPSSRTQALGNGQRNASGGGNEQCLSSTKTPERAEARGENRRRSADWR